MSRFANDIIIRIPGWSANKLSKQLRQSSKVSRWTSPRKMSSLPSMVNNQLENVIEKYMKYFEIFEIYLKHMKYYQQKI